MFTLTFCRRLYANISRPANVTDAWCYILIDVAGANLVYGLHVANDGVAEFPMWYIILLVVALIMVLVLVTPYIRMRYIYGETSTCAICGKLHPCRGPCPWCDGQ